MRLVLCPRKLVEEIAAADLVLVLSNVNLWLAFALFGWLVRFVEVFAIVVGEEVTLLLDWLFLWLLVMFLWNGSSFIVFLCKVIVLLEVLLRSTVELLILLSVLFM